MSADLRIALTEYDRSVGSALGGSGGVMMAIFSEAVEADWAALEAIRRARRLRAEFDLPTPTWEHDAWVLNVIAALERKCQP